MKDTFKKLQQVQCPICRHGSHGMDCPTTGMDKKQARLYLKNLDKNVFNEYSENNAEELYYNSLQDLEVENSDNIFENLGIMSTTYVTESNDY